MGAACARVTPLVAQRCWLWCDRTHSHTHTVACPVVTSLPLCFAVTGFQKKADRFCQPYRPSSRLSHMSYTQLHTKPPPVPHPHEHSLAHTAGPGSGFGVDGGRLVKAEALVQRQPGDNPLVGAACMPASHSPTAHMHHPAPSTAGPRPCSLQPALS